MSDIYEKAGLDYKIYSKNPTADPFHINDVEPLIVIPIQILYYKFKEYV